MILHSLSKIFQDPLIPFMIFQDVFLRHELLVYLGVHVNDASESSKPSWGRNVYFDIIRYSSREVVYTMLLSMVCEVSYISEENF